MTQQRRVPARQRAPSPTVTDQETVTDQVTPSRPADTSVTQSGTAQQNQGQPESTGREDDAVVAMEGVYIISVAARILDMHPQTLRKYERLGLIRPGRTLGMLRLYSTEDIRKLRLIRRLSDEMGLNLAGIEFALAAVQNLLTMQQRLTARLGPEAGEQVKEELDMLFESLNLPVDP